MYPRPLQSEDEQWFSWLAACSSFAFHGKHGHLTLQREARSRGEGYWYAYRSQGRRTFKRYVGRTAKLTIARLEAIASALTSELSQAPDRLIAIYALCQFIAAPGLGMLSDRYGRRPLLMICLLGSAIGYALIGFGGALWVLLQGRIIDGLTGGNFSILYAYVGDISKPEERARYFGLLGAAAGVGFIVGPVIGGFASLLSYRAPLYIAAAIIVANVIWGYFNVPESLRKELRTEQTKLAELNPFKQLLKVLTISKLRWLLLATFCFSLAFAVFGSITTVLVKQSLGWNAASIGLIYFVVGIGDILMQGVLIGRLLPIFGELKLAIADLVCEMIAYVLIGFIAFIPSPLFLWVGIVFFTVGSGLLEPSLGGLLSRAAGPR